MSDPGQAANLFRSLLGEDALTRLDGLVDAMGIGHEKKDQILHDILASVIEGFSQWVLGDRRSATVRDDAVLNGIYRALRDSGVENIDAYLLVRGLGFPDARATALRRSLMAESDPASQASVAAGLLHEIRKRDEEKPLLVDLRGHLLLLGISRRLKMDLGPSPASTNQRWKWELPDWSQIIPELEAMQPEPKP